MPCADLLDQDRSADTGETQKVRACQHADGDNVMEVEQVEVFAPKLDTHDEELMDPERRLQMAVEQKQE